jgi:predicted lactoylglutathione lyase
MGNLKRIAPIFPVRDLSASLAHYQRLGFATREYAGTATPPVTASRYIWEWCPNS